MAAWRESQLWPATASLALAWAGRLVASGSIRRWKAYPPVPAATDRDAINCRESDRRAGRGRVVRACCPIMRCDRLPVRTLLATDARGATSPRGGPLDEIFNIRVIAQNGHELTGPVIQAVFDHLQKLLHEEKADLRLLGKQGL